MNQVARTKINRPADEIQPRSHYIGGEGCRIRLAIKKI